MQIFTLILITESLISRIDVRLRSEATIEFLSTAVRPENDSLEALIRAALALRAQSPHRIWLFSTDFWTGAVSVPADLHGMASEDERIQAVHWEAETQSGIPAFQSKIALSRIGNDDAGDPQYWVTQILDDEFSVIDQTIRSANLRWKGIAHPAMHGYATQALGGQVPMLSLSQESEIREWAIETVKVLASKSIPSPYLEAPVVAMTPRMQWVWATLATSVTLTTCAMLYVHDRYAVAAMEHRMTDLNQVLESTDALSRSLQKAELALEENQKKLQSERARFVRIKQEIEQIQFDRLLRTEHCVNLMDAIATAADSESWLQRIESNASRTTLQGVSLSEASAHRFATALEQDRKLAGHRVSPAQTVSVESDFIEFSITVDLMASSMASTQELAP